MSALIRSLWLPDRPASRLLERAARELRYTQARRVLARKSHAKTTRRRLRAAGVRLSTLVRCHWP